MKKDMSKHAAGRPLSPHLGVWRWSPTMASSILHRVSGVGNSLGLLVLAWWFVALASGPEAYATFVAAASSAMGRFILFGFTVSLCFHFLNGIRHIVWDTGHGFDVSKSAAWSWFNFVGAIVLALIIWVLGYANLGAL